MNPRVLLIHPPLWETMRFYDEQIVDVSDLGNFAPLGLLSIAAALRRRLPECTIALCDAMAERPSPAALREYLRSFRPDVVGITAYTDLLPSVLAVIRLVREAAPRAHVCLGGVHAFWFPRETAQLPGVDSVVVGEGEEAFPELVARLAAGGTLIPPANTYTPARLPPACLPADRRGRDGGGYINDLDMLPFPDRSLLRPGLYYSTVGRAVRNITIATSRGCPCDCAFCDVPYKSYRMRSTDSIVAEVEQAVAVAGTREVFLYDDLFNITEERVAVFAEAVLRRGQHLNWSFRGRVDRLSPALLRLARRAGCFQVHLGIETGSDAGLRELRKGTTTAMVKAAVVMLRRAGIRSVVSYMVGLPFEDSREAIRRNVEFLVSLDPDFYQVGLFTPLPFTPYFDRGVAAGICSYEEWRAYARAPRADFHPALWTEHLTVAELVAALHEATRRVYFRPRYLFKRLLGTRTLPELQRNLRGLNTLLRNLR